MGGHSHGAPSGGGMSMGGMNFASSMVADIADAALPMMVNLLPKLPLARKEDLPPTVKAEGVKRMKVHYGPLNLIPAKVRKMLHLVRVLVTHEIQGKGKEPKRHGSGQDVKCLQHRSG